MSDDVGMPTLVRAVESERDCLLAFLGEQRAALRRATHGLDNNQARATPSTSGLCLAGLIKHVTSTEENWIGTLTKHHTASAEQSGGFDLTDRDGLPQVLEHYQLTAQRTESIVVAVDDLGTLVPISYLNPRMPAGLMRSARWVLLHVIEETARHVGHADIIRESLDGATALELVVASGTPFFA